MKEYQRTYVRKHPDRARASRLLWQSKNPDKIKQYKRTQRERHRAHHNARAAVARAVRVGKLARSLVCQLCWASESLEAHHEDYAKPLEVVWLCQPCHQFVEGRNRKLRSSEKGVQL